MSLKNPKINKDGKLSGYRTKYQFMQDAHDISDIFTERLPNHTLFEVCCHIAGFFYQKQKNSRVRIEQLEDILQSFPGFTDDAKIGDPWIEKVRDALKGKTDGEAI